jgi:hypothetical protein
MAELNTAEQTATEQTLPAQLTPEKQTSLFVKDTRTQTEKDSLVNEKRAKHIESTQQIMDESTAARKDRHAKAAEDAKPDTKPEAKPDTKPEPEQTKDSAQTSPEQSDADKPDDAQAKDEKPDKATETKADQTDQQDTKDTKADTEDSTEQTSDQPVVTIDGKDYTPDDLLELKNSGLKQADYTKKTQELAEERKQVSAEQDKIANFATGLSKLTTNKDFVTDFKDLLSDHFPDEPDLYSTLQYDPSTFKHSAELERDTALEKYGNLMLEAEKSKLITDHGLSQGQADAVLAEAERIFGQTEQSLPLDMVYAKLLLDKPDEFRGNGNGARVVIHEAGTTKKTKPKPSSDNANKDSIPDMPSDASPKIAEMTEEIKTGNFKNKAEQESYYRYLAAKHNIPWNLTRGRP